VCVCFSFLPISTLISATDLVLPSRFSLDNFLPLPLLSPGSSPFLASSQSQFVVSLSSLSLPPSSLHAHSHPLFSQQADPVLFIIRSLLSSLLSLSLPPSSAAVSVPASCDYVEHAPVS